jgi:hypothetical protein
VIILLALPLDLFFQQVVFYPNVWVSVQPGAMIPRATTYTPPDGRFVQNGSVSVSSDPTMAQVVEPFFFSNGTAPDLNLYCPTSNCTWEPYETLAVCSACDNTVGVELEFGCYHGPADWLTSISNYYDTSTFPNITHCGYFLNASSEDRVLMTGYAVDPETSAMGESLPLRLFPLTDAITLQPYYGGSLRFKNIANPIMDFLIVGTPGGAEGTYQNATPVAHECVLTWCTQTLKTSMYWGQLSQNVTYTFMNDTQQPYPWSFGVDNQDYFYDADIALTPPHQHVSPMPKSGAPTPNITFGLSNATAMQTIFLLQDVVPAFFTAQNESANIQLKYFNIDSRGARLRSVPVNPWSSEFNVSEHMERIAEAMTSTVRNTPSRNGSFDMVQGESWDMRIHVQTRWPWIILPLALLGLSLIFLVWTVVKSSRECQEVGIWKTSAIAILFNGLGDDVQKTFGSNCRMGQARIKARELRVKLVPD